MTIYWLLYAALMGALLGSLIARAAPLLWDAVTIRYWQWYRDRHPMPDAEREQLMGRIDARALLGVATMGVTAQEAVDAFKALGRAIDQ